MRGPVPVPARLALWLAGGALAAGAAQRWLPLANEDPLRGTLALLPLVGAGFAAIDLAARARGARGIAARINAAHLIALAVWSLLALTRPLNGLQAQAEALMAAFALLLAHRTALQLLALRPLLGKELPARPSTLFLALPFVTYLALLPWSTFHRPPDGDEPYYLLITHSLAYDFDSDLTNNYAAGSWRAFLDRPLEPQPGDPRGPRGEIYSRHNELLPLMLAPAYRIGGKAGALAVMAALSAMLCWVTLRLARRWFAHRPGEALLAYACVAFTPPLLLYSYQVWVEVPAALFAALALDRILEPRGEPQWGWKRWLGVGLPILLLPLLKIRFFMLAGPLLLLAWLYARRPRRPLIVLSLLFACVAGGMLAYNSRLYHNPLKIHSWDEVALYKFSRLDYAKGFNGIFYDAAFGLFATAPLWLLLLPASVLLVRRHRPLLLMLLVAFLPYLAMFAPRSEWYGGWSPPFRYALVLLPLLGLALVPVLELRRAAGARALIAALAALTMVLTLLWITVPGWTYNFADGRTYLLDGLSRRFATDFARFFPSSVRPRAATWLWPAVSVPLLSLIYLWPRRRLKAAAGWGLAALLFAAAALPALARALPTRVLEFEDPYIEKRGGHPEPARWVPDRTRFRGAWALREGEELRAPIISGGGLLHLAVESYFVENHPGAMTVELYAGDRLLDTLRFAEPGLWVNRILGPYDWPREAPLVLRARSSGMAAGAPSGVLLDSAHLAWN